jgi:hypothetical protein
MRRLMAEVERIEGVGRVETILCDRENLWKSLTLRICGRSAQTRCAPPPWDATRKPRLKSEPSLWLASEEETETGGLGEGAEIAVAGDERNAGVDAGLGDQGVTKARFATICKNLSA